MTGLVSQQPPRAVRWWLITIAALIAIMVLVGGATRLTESGLSIVEWKPVTGTLPPLNEAQWTRGVRGLQDHPAISRTQRRHESRRVQDHLLVGVEPPAARPLYRHRLSAAVPVVSLARRFECRSEAAAVDHLRARRAAGRGGLVDGGVRPDAAGRGLATSSRHPSGAGAPDLRRHRLDAAALERTATGCCRAAAENHRHGAAGADLRAALSRRAGGRLARGARLQHLARDRRRADSIRGAAVLRSSRGGAICSTIR